MKTKTKSTANGDLASRVDQLEDDVHKISRTVYDLIDALKSLPDPPCPPMCSLAVDEGYSAKNKRSRIK